MFSGAWFALQVEECVDIDVKEECWPCGRVSMSFESSEIRDATVPRMVDVEMMDGTVEVGSSG